MAETTQEELNQKLLNAARNNDIAGVKEAISLGADVNASDSGYTVLMLACHYGVITDIVKLLIKHGANIDIKDNYGRTALIEACDYGGHTGIAALLLEHGADVNIISKEGNIALFNI